MSTYLRDAEHHAEKIDYYHEYAGAAGYSQARYHHSKLEELVGRAFRSKSGKNDVPVIQALLESSRPKMDEMKKRENEADIN